MKRVIFVLLLLQTFVLADESRVEFLLDKLKERGPHDYAMIIAHRGDWRYAPLTLLKLMFA